MRSDDPRRRGGELSRLLRVSQPRMTQIMNFSHLAPYIQEELLILPRTVVGKEPIQEKQLRPIVAEVDWGRQRAMWVDYDTKPSVSSRTLCKEISHLDG